MSRLPTTPTAPPSDPFRDREQQAALRAHEQAELRRALRNGRRALTYGVLLLLTALAPSLAMIATGDKELLGSGWLWLAVTVVPLVLLRLHRRAQATGRALAQPLPHLRRAAQLTLLAKVIWIPTWLFCSACCALGHVNINVPMRY